MNVKLRIINNQNIPTLPSLSVNENDKLTTSVKGSILSHQEVDNNFGNIILYLKTIVDVIENLRNKLDDINLEDIETLKESTNILNEVSNNLNLCKDDIKTINASLTNINSELSKKIEKVKMINGNNIVGEGNLTLNITQSQFLNHLTDINFGEVGCICLLKSSEYLRIKEIYSASNLYEENINNLQGSWRCLGKINDNFGLFQRIV